MSRPVVFADPDAEVPRFPWCPGCAGITGEHIPNHADPEVYATRRQLRARGLRPGGQPLAGELVKPRSRVVAELFLVALALPKRTASQAWHEATRKATAARFRCRGKCGQHLDYIPPRRTGYACLDCAA